MTTSWPVAAIQTTVRVARPCTPRYFYDGCPFCSNPSYFLAWDQHTICWLAYPKTRYWRHCIEYPKFGSTVNSTQHLLGAVSSGGCCCTCSAVIRLLIMWVNVSACSTELRSNSRASFESRSSFTICTAHGNTLVIYQSNKQTITYTNHVDSRSSHNGLVPMCLWLLSTIS